MSSIHSSSDTKYRSLQQANDLRYNLDFDLNSDVEDDQFSRLVGLALRKLRITHIELSSRKGSMVDYLDYNDIPYRSVMLSDNLADKELVTILALAKGRTHYVLLFQEKRIKYIFNPLDESFTEINLSNYSDYLEDEAIELFPPMQPEINGAWDVLKFSFSSELLAISALLAASAVVMLFNLSIPMLTNLLVTKILPEQQSTLLIDSIFVVILIVIGSSVSGYLQQMMMLRLETVTDMRLQTAVWDRLLRLPMSFFSKFTTGDMASRVLAISQLRQVVGGGSLTTLISSLFAVSYFVLMYRYNASLANWALLSSGLGVIFIFWLANKQLEFQLQLQAGTAEVTNFALQSLNGIAQIKVSGTEPFLFLQWMKRVSDYAKLNISNQKYQDGMSIYTELSIPVFTTVVFTVAVLQIISPTSSSQNPTALVASIVSFYSAFTAFLSQINSAVSQLSNIYAEGFTLWKRACPILYAKVEKGYTQTAIRSEIAGNIRFDNIVFKYPGSSDLLLDSASFFIPQGKHTALTGQSGCGKTTIFKLLLGFLEPIDGEIYIDSLPLSKLAIRSYRKQIGVVLQNSSLISGSIYNAVTGGMSYTEDEVWAALERAQIADDVSMMPMKLDTILNTGGTNISGGQRQRLAIARALITNPKILFMDEATSALDNISQEKITEYLDSTDITRLTIAHRFSTVESADQILKVENRKVQPISVSELLAVPESKNLLS